MKYFGDEEKNKQDQEGHFNFGQLFDQKLTVDQMSTISEK